MNVMEHLEIDPFGSSILINWKVWSSQKKSHHSQKEFATRKKLGGGISQRKTQQNKSAHQIV
jgi:hypothetical protein